MSLDDCLDLYISDMERCRPVKDGKEAELRWGKPPCCHGIEGECGKEAQWSRQHTFFQEERSNWVFLCDECRVVNDARWEEQWAEYYQMTR